MRLFLAVPLTEEARQAISTLVRGRAGSGLPGRVVRPENWHLTLRFLGDVGEVERDRVAAALDAADLGPAFEVSWQALGAFPRERRATVLWIGVERGREAAAALAEAVAGALEVAGFPPEDRPFRAHLTLSRIRPHQDVSALLEAAEPLGITMPVDRVALYRSHLGPGGARYEELDSFPLG